MVRLCRVWGLGFGVWGLGFGVWGLGFGVWGLGFGVWGLGFGVWGLGFGVWGLGFGVGGPWRRVGWEKGGETLLFPSPPPPTPPYPPLTMGSPSLASAPVWSWCYPLFSCSCSVVVQVPAQPVRWRVVCAARSGLAILVGLLLVPPNGQPSGFNARDPNSIARMPSGKHDRAVCRKGFCNARQFHSKVRANILGATAPLMLGSKVPDWHAKCAVFGFVFGAVFWAAFLMPAAGRAQNLRPRRGRSFGTAELSVLGPHFWRQVFIYLSGCFVSPPRRPLCVPFWWSGFRPARRAQKTDPRTVNPEQKNKNKTMPTSRFPVLRGGGRPVPLGRKFGVWGLGFGV